MSDIQRYENSKGKNAFDRILASYDPESKLPLDSDDEQTRMRWIEADRLMMTKKFKTKDIIDQLVARFNISKFTAQNDIKQAYALFGQVRVISKQYVLYHHIEHLQMLIAQYSMDKSLVHLVPKLSDSLIKALAQVPDEVAKQKAPPTTVVLTVGNGNGANSKLAFDEAKEKWEALKKKKQEQEYTDFEDVQE